MIDTVLKRAVRALESIAEHHERAAWIATLRALDDGIIRPAERGTGWLPADRIAAKLAAPEDGAERDRT